MRFAQSIKNFLFLNKDGVIPLIQDIQDVWSKADRF